MTLAFFFAVLRALLLRQSCVELLAVAVSRGLCRWNPAERSCDHVPRLRSRSKLWPVVLCIGSRPFPLILLRIAFELSLLALPLVLAVLCCQRVGVAASLGGLVLLVVLISLASRRLADDSPAYGLQRVVDALLCARSTSKLVEVPACSAAIIGANFTRPPSCGTCSGVGPAYGLQRVVDALCARSATNLGSSNRGELIRLICRMYLQRLVVWTLVQLLRCAAQRWYRFGRSAIMLDWLPWAL